MTRPIVRPPGFQPYRFYDLVRGRTPRKLYLPPGVASQINQILKQRCIDIRLFVIEPKQEVSDEGSD